MTNDLNKIYEGIVTESKVFVCTLHQSSGHIVDKKWANSKEEIDDIKMSWEEKINDGYTMKVKKWKDPYEDGYLDGAMNHY